MEPSRLTLPKLTQREQAAYAGGLLPFGAVSTFDDRPVLYADTGYKYAASAYRC